MSMNDFVNMLTPEQKAVLLKALQGENNTVLENMPKETKQENINAINESFITDTKQPLNNRRREPVKARKNEWVDTGEGRDFDTEYGERSPRTRKPYKKVNVECSVCGKSFKADPKYVYGEYHRCSRCVGR